MPIRLTPDQLAQLTACPRTPLLPPPQTRVRRSHSSQPLRPREREIQRAVIDALSARGWLVLRTNAGQIPVGDRIVRLGPRGWPDLTCITDRGVVVCVEVKRSHSRRHRLTPHQEAVHAELARRGVRVETVCSVDEAIRLTRDVASADAGAAHSDPVR